MNASTLKHYLQLSLFAAAVTLGGTLRAEYNEIDTAFPMSGPTDFIAEAGVTNVYSGLISGTGPAVIKGGGTVAFSNADNTYTGGTLISNAVFRLDADGCAGTGAITGAVNSAHVFMNCANVPNDMVFMQTYSSNTQLNPSGYPAAGQCFILPLQSAVTVKGLVKLSKSSYLFNETSPAIVSSPTVTYEKGVSGTGYIFTVPKGRMIFKGRYISTYDSRSRLGGISSAQGTMEFRASSNELYRLDYYNADMDFKAVDAFPKTLFYYEYGSDGYAKTYLNGNDQTVLGFSWSTGSSWPQSTENGTGQCWTSTDTPATVRITGCQPSRAGNSGTFVNRLALFGKITLVMEDFSVRKSTTTGDLIISNGDFRVSGTASFPNVPNIYVGTGGSFTNASTKANAFAGCRNLTVLGKMTCTGDATPFTYGAVALTLGADAEFSLPAGATMTVGALKVGGESYAEGTFGDGGTSLPQILQGTIVVRRHDRYVDCNTTDTVNDGSKAHPYKTIKAATDSAASGDVIHVAPGTYGEAEGTQPSTSRIAARVVVPANVTLESTGGAKETFIVGAAATGDQIDNATYGTGTNAVRCVYAKSGAVVRGFTLTGGRGVGSGEDSDNGMGPAFFSVTARAATLEDCIVSNNASYRAASIYQAVVKRCHILENIGTRIDNASSPAGSGCRYYNSIIDKNKGHATIQSAYAFENCTIGANNVVSDTNPDPQVLWWYGAGDHAVINSVVLGGRYYMGGGAVICCTNCLIVDVNNNVNATMKERAYNTIITNSAAAKVDSEYRPKLGEFVGIDAGDAGYSSAALGDRDFYGTPRILNGQIDIGAVEYDWRPTFAAELGRRFTMTYASPTVTTNATGGVKLEGDVGALGERALPVCIAGTVNEAGPYAFTFALSGGSAAVYVGGVLAGAASGAGEQSIRFDVSDAAAEIRFVFTPDAENPGAAILRKFAGARGFSISFR